MQRNNTSIERRKETAETVANSSKVFECFLISNRYVVKMIIFAQETHDRLRSVDQFSHVRVEPPFSVKVSFVQHIITREN